MRENYSILRPNCIIFLLSKMIHLRSYAILAATVAALFFGTACSTVSSRIKERPGAFQKLPPPEQALVQAGKIQNGFDADAVYLAWGKADGITQGATPGKPSETWTYIGYRQETIQYFDMGARPLGRRGFAPEPITTPIYVSHPYVRRQVVFQNGKVVAWSEGKLP
jgi:hypothetical protein